MPTGTVKFFDMQKGYGFITDESGGKDAFVHISAVKQRACIPWKRNSGSLTSSRTTSAARAAL